MSECLQPPLTPPRSGGVLALCRDVRRTPRDGLVYSRQTCSGKRVDLGGAGTGGMGEVVKRLLVGDRQAQAAGVVDGWEWVW